MSTYGLSALAPDLAGIAATAAAAARAGFNAVWASECYARSGSISMAAMATSTSTCRIGNGNGTKRMMSDWHSVADSDAPALRIEELVPLIRRIWNLHEGPIRHEDRFYRMNLVPTGPVDPPTRDIPIITGRATAHV